MLFVFLGIYIVVGCRSFNEYILKMAIYFMPMALPLLNFSGFAPSFWWYLLPTQGTLVLLEAAMGPVAAWKIIYAVLYLLAATGIAFYFALKTFSKEALD